MGKLSVLDHAWSTIPSMTAPSPILCLDTLSATDVGQFYKRQSFDLLDVKLCHRVLDGILNAVLRGIAGAHPSINGQYGIWFALGILATQRPPIHWRNTSASLNN